MSQVKLILRDGVPGLGEAGDLDDLVVEVVGPDIVEKDEDDVGRRSRRS